jgi:hypothetical protein
MKPTVGRIVHYQAYGTPGGEHPSLPRAAIITAVHHQPKTDTEEPGPLSSSVDLCVLNPTGQFFNQGVPFSETPKPGCWSWPPREG